MNRSIEKTIAVGFGLAFLVLLAVGLVQYRTTKQLVEAGQGVAHTDVVLAGIQTVLGDVKDAESWLRGYAATGDDLFLAPCRSAISETPNDLRQLRQLTLDNPRQQRQLDTLELLLARRFNHMERVIELRRDRGNLAARGFMLQGEGIRLTNDIERVTDDIEKEERELLATRTAAVEADKRRTDAFILVGSFLAIGLLLVSASIVYHELSQRKRADEALRDNEERYRALVTATSQIVWTTNAQGEVSGDFPSWRKFTGQNEEEIKGWGWANALHPDDQKRTTDEWSNAVGKRSLFYTDYRLRRHDGEYRYFAVRGVPVLEPDGSVREWVGACTDITDRLLAAEAVRRAGAYNRSLLEASLDPLVTISPQGRITDVNHATVEVTGYSRKELIGSDFSSYFTEPERARAAYQQAFREGWVQDYELEVRCRAGHTTPVVYNASVYKDENGKVSGVFAAARDITQRKRAEAALRESQALTNAIVDSTSDLIWSVDPERFALLSFNCGLRDYFLHQRGIHIQPGMDPDDLLPNQDFSDRWRGFYQRALSEGSYTTDYEAVGSNILQLTLNLLRRDGKVFGISVFAKDITEQKRAEGELLRLNQELLKSRQELELRVLERTAELRDANEQLRVELVERRQAEEALRRSEEQNRLLADLLERSDQPFGVGYPDGRLGPVNEAFERLTGYSRVELRAIDWAVALTPPEWQDIERTKLEELHRTGQPVRYEKEYVRKDGSRVPIGLLVHLRKDEEGQPAFYYSFITDLTARKRAEEALGESEGRERARAAELEALMEAAPVGIFMSGDTECRRMSGNRAAYNLLRRPRGANLSKSGAEDEKPVNFRAMKDGKEIPLSGLPMQKTAATGEAIRDHEMDFVFADGDTVNVLGNVVPLLDESGRPRGAVGAFVDITERKQAEEALRRSEADLREAQRIAQVGSWTWEVPTDSVTWSEQIYSIFGRDPKLPAPSVAESADLFTPESWARLREAQQEALLRGTPYLLDLGVVRADGTRRWMVARGEPERDSSGDVVRLRGTVQDITERKRAEEALRASEERFRVLSEAMPQIVWSADASGAVDYYNPRAIEYGGVNPEEVYGWNWLTIIHPDDLEATQSAWRRTLVAGATSAIEHRLRRADGQFRWHLTRAVPLRDAEGQVMRWIGTATDIHEKKLAEEELERRVGERTAELAKSKALLETVTSNAPVILFATDAQGVFSVHTGKAVPATGRQTGEFIGKHYQEVLSNNPRARENIRRALTGEVFTDVLEGPVGTAFEIRYTPLRDADGKIAGIIGLSLDITERKEAEERLRASEEKYRTLFDSIDEGFCTIEVLFDENNQPRDYRFLELNPSFERQTGIQNARGRTMREIAPQREEHWFEIYGKIALTGEPARFENEAAQLHRWYEVYAFRIGEPQQKNVAILFNDITERRRAEEALQESETAFRTLAELVPQLVWICTPDGLNVFFNQRWVDYTGLTLEESYGKGWNTPFHPEDKQPAWDAWKHATETGGMYEIESRLRAADGSYRWFLMRGEPLRDATGGIVKWFGTCTDIDDLKRAEVELRRLNRALSAVTECNEAMVRASEESDLLERVCRLLVEVGGYRLVWVGYAEQDAAKSVRSVAHAGVEEGYLATLHLTWADEERGRGPTGTAIRTGQPSLARNLLEDPNVAPWRAEATRRGYGSSIALPLMAEGRTLGALTLYSQAVDAFDGKEVSLLEDLATDLAFGIHTLRVGIEHKRAEEAVRTLNENLERRVRDRTAELEAMNEELEAFTYSVSHDLRAPLRHIDGFSRLLKEEYSPKLDDTAQHYLDRIRTGTLNMGRLIDDLLSLSRIGRREPALRLTDLGSLVKEVLNELESDTMGRRIEWKVGGLPLVECDPSLLKLVLYNLLSNALKFTRPREVAVIEVGQTVVKGQPAVFVRDNGVGFSMKHVDKLFGVFQRLHREADFEGTGVGLATVQRIIHKHSGRTWAEGAVDKGATFFFTLSRAENQEEHGKVA